MMVSQKVLFGIQMGLQGYTGTRKGVSGSLLVKYEF
jgi:hypothetical protein